MNSSINFANNAILAFDARCAQLSENRVAFEVILNTCIHKCMHVDKDPVIEKIKRPTTYASPFYNEHHSPNHPSPNQKPFLSPNFQPLLSSPYA